MKLCNEAFLKKIAIKLNEIDDRIYFVKDINYIFDKYGIQGDSQEELIYIENLVGFYNDDEITSTSLSETLDCFFDSTGDSYHSRAVEMLNYDEHNVIEGLNQSFKEEPIKTLKVDYDKHIILSNGMHRFMVLRILYLKAKSKCKTSEELNELNEKFIIPVNATVIDSVKTYCKYLINLFQPAQIMDQYFESLGKEVEIYTENGIEKAYQLEIIKGWNDKTPIYLSEEQYKDYYVSVKRLSNEYDDKGRKTGRCEIVFFNDRKIYLTDDELIEFTKKVIYSCKNLELKLTSKLTNFDFAYAYENIESFRLFMQTHFSDILKFDDLGIKSINKQIR